MAMVGPGTFGSRCLRFAGVLAIVVIVLGLELAWRSHTWTDLEKRAGQCVMVGQTVDNGRVPIVPCHDSGARRVRSVVRPDGSCGVGETLVRVRQEISHDTGYIGALCLGRP